MAKQMDKIIAAFKNVVQNSSPVAGRILNTSGAGVNISSTWSQRNMERKGNVRSELFQVVNIDSKDINTLTSTDLSTELLTSYSPSCTYRGLFRDIPASGKTPKKQHLEVWKKNMLWKVFDLASYEVHGDVYTDSEFSCFQWSPCETKILYIAEKKQPKSEPFLPKKHTEKPDEDTKKGCEYELMEDWGEALVGKCSPVLCVCDLQTDIISVVSGIPEDLSLGQGVWAPDGGIVGIAWITKPRRLGLIYCSNRESFIFHISQDYSVFRKLSSEGVAVRSPKFSTDGSHLVWLERKAGGPHHACHRLMIYDWTSGQKSVLVDIVQEETKTSNGKPFFGLYNLDLGRCWISNNKKIVLSTPQRASVKTYLIDPESKEIFDICDDNDDNYNLSVLDASGQLILCAKSSLDSCSSLLLGCLSDNGVAEWIPLVQQEPLVTGVKVGVMRFEAQTQPNPVSKFSALYMVPKDVSNAPLIVWSHGGPHSQFTNGSSVIASFFASLGFGMVMVNYRGSTGAGQDSVEFLLGRVGETDVADVQQAAEAVLKLFPSQLSPDKCLLFGGSHGGFLSLQLSAQFPTNYKSCVALNPVVDLTSFCISDIPDWGAVEAGFPYSSTLQLSTEMFERMKALSPLSRVSSVTAPTLLLLGKKDLRVPFHQGMGYYHQLVAKGVKTRALIYDDNHSLSQLPHEVDFAINTALWFLDCIDYSIE